MMLTYKNHGSKKQENIDESSTSAYIMLYPLDISPAIKSSGTLLLPL